MFEHFTFLFLSDGLKWIYRKCREGDGGGALAGTKSKKSYGDRERELAFALYAVSGNISEVAEKLNIPRSTVGEWLKKYSPDALEDIRKAHKEVFIAEAWGIIGDTQEVLRRRLRRAIDSEDAIDELVRIVEDVSEDDMSDTEKSLLIKKLRAISCEDLSKLAAVMGTMYDKAALASKEATAILGGSLRLEDFNADS